MEVDRRLEVLGGAEPAGRFLHPPDDGVDTLEAGVGKAMREIGAQVRQMPLDQLGHRRWA